MLSGLIDQHKDETAVIIGSGPSLHGLDLDLIRPHVTIAVNSSIVKMPEADYYFSCDFGMTVWQSWLLLKTLDCKLVLYNVDVGFRHLEYLTKEDTFVGIAGERIQYFDMKDNDLKMNSVQLIRGSTSTQVAVHFAYLSGCSPIILVGCDCRYVEGKYHYYDFPGEIIDKIRKPEYKNFKSDNLIVREGDSNRYLDGHYACWKKIREQNPDVRVIDCSGGRLNMFPQMTLREAVDERS